MLLYPSSAFGSGLGTSAQLPVTSHLNPSDLKGLVWPRLAPWVGASHYHPLACLAQPRDVSLRQSERETSQGTVCQHASY